MAFRKKCETEKALQLCGARCVVCGWDQRSPNGTPLVVGAHVKPISSLENDCFDDIIALCPNHHAEFDAFLFYIDPETRDIVYIGENPLVQWAAVHVPYVKKEYLAYRKYIIEKNHPFIQPYIRCV